MMRRYFFAMMLGLMVSPGQSCFAQGRFSSANTTGETELDRAAKLAEVRRQYAENEVRERITTARRFRDAGNLEEAARTLESILPFINESGGLTTDVQGQLSRKVHGELELVEKAIGTTRKPYVFGKVGRIEGDLIEFDLGARDGLRVGDILPVQRPFDGGPLVCEVKVWTVLNNTSCARAPKGKVVPGDGVVFQKLLRDPPAQVNDLRFLNTEITFANPAGQTDRRVFNGRIESIEWSGPLDVSDLNLQLVVEGKTFKARYKARDIKQMRINGFRLVADPVKQTLVHADIMPIREQIRENDRRVQELRLAEIRADENVRIAQSRADENVRIAQVNAQYQYQQALVERDAARERADRAERQADDLKRELKYSLKAAQAKEKEGPSAGYRAWKGLGAMLSLGSAVSAYSSGNGMEFASGLYGTADGIYGAIVGY
jgi:hypothetical protein